MNELLLIVTLILVYGGATLFYKFFGKYGLYGFSILATVLANIECLVVIDAFGMEMTLGNILFAVTYLITDCLSENHGRKDARLAVIISTCGAIFFALLSQIWLLYTPAESDWAYPSFQALFTNTPRLVFASLVVYAIAQFCDVWLYHRWWKLTEKIFGDKRKGLWVRNNGSTLISQLVNTVLFTILAFAGVHTWGTIVNIIISSYVIFIFTSLLDTPMLYLCRRINDKRKPGELLIEED